MVTIRLILLLSIVGGLLDACRDSSNEGDHEHSLVEPTQTKVDANTPVVARVDMNQQSPTVEKPMTQLADYRMSTRPYQSVPLKTRSQFVGADKCRSCHANAYNDWSRSSHGLAGGIPTKRTVVAPFDGKPLKMADATVYPIRRGKDFYFKVELYVFLKSLSLIFNLDEL